MPPEAGTARDSRSWWPVSTPGGRQRGQGGGEARRSAATPPWACPQRHICAAPACAVHAASKQASQPASKQAGKLQSKPASISPSQQARTHPRGWRFPQSCRAARPACPWRPGPDAPWCRAPPAQQHRVCSERARAGRCEARLHKLELQAVSSACPAAARHAQPRLACLLKLNGHDCAVHWAPLHAAAHAAPAAAGRLRKGAAKAAHACKLAQQLLHVHLAGVCGHSMVHVWALLCSVACTGDEMRRQACGDRMAAHHRPTAVRRHQAGAVYSHA